MQSNASEWGATILVVEDDDSVRELICEILNREGYRTLQAGDALEGLALIEREDGRIDLLLSDVILPGTDGVQFAMQVRSILPELAIVLMSGNMDKAICLYFESGCRFGLLEKPFTVEAVRVLVRQCLGSRTAA